MSQAKAVGYLDLNIQGFDQALKTAKNLMVTFAAGFSAYKIGEFFKDGIIGAVDFGKEMQSASRAMGGFDPGKLLLAQKALEKAGMGAEEARGHVSDFIREGRDIADIFGGSENYARALKSAAQDYGSQADVLSKSGEKLQSIWNTMESVGSKVKTFFLVMTAGFVDPLQMALDYLNEIDLAGVGAEFGQYIDQAADTLAGVFANGDIMETIGLGLTVAFQEAVNYLVGGINYAGGMADTVLGPALVGAAGKMGEMFGKIFSADGLETFALALGGIEMRFIADLLDGFSEVLKFLGAGLAMAIQAAVEAIPGLSKLIGSGGGHRTFDQMYNDADGIPKSATAGIRDFGKGATDEAGGKLKEFADSLFRGGSGGGYKKGSVFDTKADSAHLAELLAKGLTKGKAMEIISREKHAKDEKGSKSVLTSFSASPFKVVADSLAKVGGGGGYLRVGQTLAEKTAMQQLMALKQSNKTSEAILQETKKNRPPTTKLQR